jgi:hypothetical protein
MSRTTRKWAGTLALLGLLIIALATLAGCGGQPAAQPTAVAQVETAVPPTEAPPAPTATAIPPTQVPEPSPTLAPTDTPAPEPTATATEAPAAEPVALDSANCITCHTSEETLQKLAVEDEPVDSLSEGEG